MKKRYVIMILFLFCVSFFSLALAGNDSTSGVKTYIKSVEETRQGMTLWQMFKAGGVVMIVLFLFSVGTVAVIVYNFLTLKIEELCPKLFAEKIIKKLEAGKEKAVLKICDDKQNVIAKITRTGLEKQSKGTRLVRESMESVVRAEIGNLWKNIGYLADIASISPLIGLLGTVLGMIRAFNAIAFQSAVVKPILIAGGVSQAMVTTAAGLIIAIPAMVFYTYFKGKVQDISNIVENYSTDIIKILEEKAEQQGQRNV